MGKSGGTIRLTAAQAMVKWLSVQLTPEGDRYIDGMWAIFGHGNVAGMGEALHAYRDVFPTWRGPRSATTGKRSRAACTSRRAPRWIILAISP